MWLYGLVAQVHARSLGANLGFSTFVISEKHAQNTMEFPPKQDEQLETTDAASCVSTEN